MVLNFKIKNFRSIREQISISFLPSTKIDENDLPNNVIKNDIQNYLSTLIIYGRNASGKSNILLALEALRDLVTTSDKLKHGDKLFYYTPYLFEEKFKNAPVEFEIEFIGSDNIRYKYGIAYMSEKIIKEFLYFYPNRKRANLFIRNNKDIKTGEHFKGEKKVIEKDILENQLFLSKSGSYNINYLKEAYLFFKDSILSMTFLDTDFDNQLLNDLIDNIFESEYIKKNIENILKSADTNIEEIIFKKKDSILEFWNKAPDKLKNERWKYFLKTRHLTFKNKKLIDSVLLNFNDESLGTQKFLGISVLILANLMKGSTIIIDELDKSLHPLLTRLLINLFHNPQNNPNKAQLIFATHDISLLDHDMFRRDQICFVEKEYEGNTIFYKLSDFKDVRKDAPYEKWYMNGRFNAIPVVSDIKLEF